jgi:WhiB family redox-sensing transcriptional regulator
MQLRQTQSQLTVTAARPGKPKAKYDPHEARPRAPRQRTTEMSDFYERAACKGIAADFFPDYEQDDPRDRALSTLPIMRKVEAAKAICAKCPVKGRCLDLALANHERWGIWGGMTTKERRKEANRRKTLKGSGNGQHS